MGPSIHKKKEAAGNANTEIDRDVERKEDFLRFKKKNG